MVSGFLFIAFWEPLFIIIFGTCLLFDFFCARSIQLEKNKYIRKFFYGVALLFYLNVFIVFHYYDFFFDKFLFVLEANEVKGSSLIPLLLPIGIMFIVLQSVSYITDVYFHRCRASENLYTYAAFYLFFPRIAAGPLERCSKILVQFQRAKVFNRTLGADGIRQFTWGLFKKVVVAESCRVQTDFIFNGYETLPGSVLILGAVLFSVQIYADFSGYCDMACGIGKMFGIRLSDNFRYPYFSRDIAEFWRRWHITLSGWFRDYVYIPLGGSKGGGFRKIFNVFAIFAVSGIWHGIGWHYFVWGMLNALYIIPLVIAKRNRTHLNNPGRFDQVEWRELVQMFWTFLLVSLTWVFFRSDSLWDAILFCSGFFFETFSMEFFNYLVPLPFALILFGTDWVNRHRKEAFFSHRTWINVLFYIGLVVLMIFFGHWGHQFIYWDGINFNF